MANFKPTLKDPMSDQSKKFEKGFKKTIIKTGAPAINLNEVDGMLSEVEQSLKKKIFSLAKMESLVFSDPKLSAIYEEMAENGEEKYGYHYNETIMNMLFNDYVLNSPKYLQKYKMAIPKEKKRRDKSGINQLKKAGEKKMTQSGLPKLQKTEVDEGNEAPTKVMFLVNEKDPEDPDLFAYFPEENHDREGKFKTAYSHIGQHSSASPQYAAESRPATPEEYADLKAELENQVGYNLEVLNGMQESTSAGSAGGAAGYVGYAGPAAWSTKGDLLGKGKKKGGGNTGKATPMNKPISRVISITESNYLTDPSGFEKYVEELDRTLNGDFIQINEQSNAEFIPKNSQAYGTVDNMSPENQKVIKKDIQTGKLDNNSNIKGGLALQENLGKLTTVEQVKALGRKLTKEDIPNLAGEALYKMAINLANRMLPIGWNELADVNSMWDYIDENGGMTYEQLVEAVKEGCNDRLADEGMSLDDLNEKAKSKSQQRFMGMVNAYKNGDLSGDDVSADIERAADSMTDNEVDDFAKTKHKGLPEKIKEDMQTMIQNNGTSMSNKAQATGDQSSGVPVGMQATGGLNESDITLLEEINKELEAFSIHHDKLKLMSEDKKTPSMVQGDRLRAENPKNFKSDLQHSGTKEIIDVEKELQWKDQQTDVGDEPQELGQDIEKKEIKVADMKSNQALKNVGNSTNRPGDEIPKRNLTTKEQEEVNLYRNGLHSPIFDNEPSERFEDRMKADMGEEIYDQRNKQIEFKGKAPMYNKDPQPIEDTTAKKVQFDKEQTGWNERMGIGNQLKESMITGRYIDVLGKRRLIEFRLNEANLSEDVEGLHVLDFTGLGNTYNSKTVDKKVIVNEAVVSAMASHKFYTNGKEVVAVKNPVQLLSESDERKMEMPVLNEQMDKMKHLLGYKPDSFVSTSNVKKNRGF